MTRIPWGCLADEIIGCVEKKIEKLSDDELVWCLEYVIDDLEMRRNKKLEEMGEYE